MLGLPHVRLSLKWEVLYKYDLACKGLFDSM
jgi:hypothetical protein